MAGLYYHGFWLDFTRDSGLRTTDTEDRRTLLRSARDNIHDAQQRGPWKLRNTHAWSPARRTSMRSHETISIDFMPRSASTGVATERSRTKTRAALHLLAALRRNGRDDPAADSEVRREAPHHLQSRPNRCPYGRGRSLYPDGDPSRPRALARANRVLMHAEFSDIKRSEKTFRVRGKPRREIQSEDL